MNYTQTKPTQAGFYWMRGGGWPKGTIVEVIEDAAKQPTLIRGIGPRLSSTQPLERFREEAFLWAGPIAEPAQP